jgi:hypothetical protein
VECCGGDDGAFSRSSAEVTSGLSLSPGLPASKRTCSRPSRIASKTRGSGSARSCAARLTVNQPAASAPACAGSLAASIRPPAPRSNAGTAAVAAPLPNPLFGRFTSRLPARHGEGV